MKKKCSDTISLFLQLPPCAVWPIYSENHPTVMGQHKTAETVPPETANGKKQKMQAGAKDQPTLQAVHQAKETGKQAHLRALRTMETYSQHVNQACAWLQSHFKEDGSLSITSHPEESSEIYHDPASKDVFEGQPNHCSNEALSIYLGWKGFKENCSQSTIDGIWVGFKAMWEEASVL